MRAFDQVVIADDLGGRRDGLIVPFQTDHVLVAVQQMELPVIEDLGDDVPDRIPATRPQPGGFPQVVDRLGLVAAQRVAVDVQRLQGVAAFGVPGAGVETISPPQFPNGPRLVGRAGETADRLGHDVFQRPPIPPAVGHNPRVVHIGLADVLDSHRPVGLPALYERRIADRYPCHCSVNGAAELDLVTVATLANDFDVGTRLVVGAVLVRRLRLPGLRGQQRCGEENRQQKRRNS